MVVVLLTADVHVVRTGYFPSLGVFGKEEVVLPVRQGRSVVINESHEHTGNQTASA